MVVLRVILLLIEHTIGIMVLLAKIVVSLGDLTFLVSLVLKVGKVLVAREA